TGSDLGTSAGADTSAISISGLAEFSAEILELLADLARHATFPEEQFERERRKKIEELRVERTTPAFLATERFRRVLFGDHPYAIIAPTEAQVTAYQREQLAHFYKHHYTPANATLILVGDFEAGEMLKRVESVFADWKGARPETQLMPVPPETV